MCFGCCCSRTSSVCRWYAAAWAAADAGEGWICWSGLGGGQCWLGGGGWEGGTGLSSKGCCCCCCRVCCDCKGACSGTWPGWGLPCSRICWGVPKAWPTWKYEYLRAWKDKDIWTNYMSLHSVGWTEDCGDTRRLAMYLGWTWSLLGIPLKQVSHQMDGFRTGIWDQSLQITGNTLRPTEIHSASQLVSLRPIGLRREVSSTSDFTWISSLFSGIPCVE